MSVAKSPAGQRRLSAVLRFAPLSCVGNPEAKVLPLLIALQGYRPPEDSGLRRLATAGLEDRTIASLFSPSRPGVPTSADTLLNSSNAIPVINWSGFHPGMEGVKTGDVIAISGLRLELPAKDPSTTLIFSRDVTLQDRETAFFLALVPAPDSLDRAPAVHLAGAQPPRKAADAPKAVEETEICASSGCRQLAHPVAEVGNHALWSVALPELGFQARPGELLAGLGTAASVHFLGEDQILLTFPLHTLAKRSTDLSPFAKPRNVRAVLLSRSDGRVLKVTDWPVKGSTGSYIWSFGQDHVLIQRGNDLVVLGPDLQPSATYSLPGPVSFVSVAPGGELLLLATLHEKHTMEEHDALSRFLGPNEPIDEDYDLTALDTHLHTIGTQHLYTAPAEPAILRSSVVSARQGRADHWQIARTSWAGARTVIANVVSTCAVRVSSLPLARILVQGCVPNQVQFTWYRVLNENGATLLKGENDRFDYMQQAGMDVLGDKFAVASTRFDKPFDFSAPVPAGSFTNEAVDVYRTDTGKLLVAVHLPAGSPEHESFALSPGGDTMVVFTVKEIRAYSLTAP